jgi:uncharacterized protein YecA (UPF0149 family)
LRYTAPAKTQDAADAQRRQPARPAPVQQATPEPVASGNGGGMPDEPEILYETVRRDGDKVGRNDPCPCGSGKKYKRCHGINA